MQLFKFSFLLFIFSTHAFNDMDCLESNFQVSVSHKAMPFGLTKNVLGVEKKGCEVVLSHRKLKLIKKNWLIDVCREPVHIKNTKGAVEVLKKTEGCGTGGKTAFCEQSKYIKTIVQDDGLIFAKGEKESLGSEHGQIYCAYLLLKAYLDRDIVFSRTKTYNGVLEGKTPPQVTAPIPQEVVAPRPVIDGVTPVEEAEALPSSAPEETQTTPSTGTGSF